MTNRHINSYLDKIEHNAGLIVRNCSSTGIKVIVVTKAVCGNPHIANAFIKVGIKELVDPRLKNIKRLGLPDFLVKLSKRLYN